MNTRATIYVFSTAFWPLVGGAEIAAEEVIRRLEDSFDFVVITGRLKKNLKKEEVRGGCTILRIGFGNAFDKILLPVLGPFIVHQTDKKRPAQLFWPVMVSFASGIPYIFNILFKRHIPIVLTLQEGDPESHLRHSRGGLIGLAWRMALRRSSAVTAISSYLARLAKGFGYQKNVQLISNGVDLALFEKKFSTVENDELRTSLEIPEGAKIIVTTSRLVKKNGIDILIRAFLALPQDLKGQAYLLILGDGAEKESLKRLATNKRILFLGSRPYHDLPRYLAIADVFVRPSRSEGMGNSFIEAMAAGVPIIGTPVGGIPEFLVDGETGLLAEPENPNSTAAAIGRILTDTRLRNLLIEAGKKKAQEYNWHDISEKYGAVFLAEMNKKRSVLIATGIFPPAIGGPALYALALADYFKQKGWQVSILTYAHGDPTAGVHRVSLEIPSGVRHSLTFLKAINLVFKADAVLLLDHASLGFPVAIASRILGKRYIVRVGGDFLWEGFVMSRRAELSLPDFYQRAPDLSFKERIIFQAVRYTLQHAATVAFNTEWQKDIFIRAYGLDPTKVTVVQNVCLARQGAAQESEREYSRFLYVGRFLFLKNLKRTIRSFITAQKKMNRPFMFEIIGEGPEEEALKTFVKTLHTDRVVFHASMAQKDMFERLESARAAAVASYSDVAPNIITESLALGTPAILTKYSGLEKARADGVLRVDPLDESSIEAAFLRMMDDGQYADLRKAVAVSSPRSWSDVAKEYAVLL
ncbi:MAG: glycosyltransferase family 4 protein [Candidatus Sungbacteria bacterium]|uniref:Glycosyltransferase family 4 protein n=1 Tax=Candidatus Sungiibacteriota bacterium TaxID=2750080 RepID=A0A9D6LMG0_9BACT|nr:glycosyltransferase family 4 protein [Candidatus Sungbacteria bacterium]